MNPFTEPTTDTETVIDLTNVRSGQTPGGATATITRAVVELQTVRIGPKQMTKAVYTQLPVVQFDELVDVWGFVAVCPKHCLRDIVFTPEGWGHAHVIGTVPGNGGAMSLATAEYLYRYTGQPIRDVYPQLYIAV